MYENKCKNVRKNIVPGNSKSLWNAVKIAKDINISPIPTNMQYDGNTIKIEELPDAFSKHFKDKVDNIISKNNLNGNVYNGSNKIQSNNINFMEQSNVVKAILSIKIKNCEVEIIFFHVLKQYDNL